MQSTIILGNGYLYIAQHVSLFFNHLNFSSLPPTTLLSHFSILLILLILAHVNFFREKLDNGNLRYEVIGKGELGVKIC